MDPITWADSATRFVTRGFVKGYAGMTEAKRREVWAPGLAAFREANPITDEEAHQVASELNVQGFIDAADVLREMLVPLLESAHGDRVRELRENLGMTLEELTVKVNEHEAVSDITSEMIADIENGEELNPDPDLIQALEWSLDAAAGSIAELVGGSDHLEDEKDKE